MSRDQTPARPLEGLRVLDLTRVLAGPYCTMILGDLGADVVKIEHPVGGDDARAFGPFLPSGLSGYFASINRGKRSVALDLKDAAQRGIFLQLVDKADVLVENFRPGTMKSLGFAAETLRERNLRLVFASLSGYGQTADDDRRAAYDVVIQAMSGLMSITGVPESPPVRVGTSISDILTGMYGAIAILAALRERDRTGRGAVLDLAMLDCTVSALENAIARYSVTGEVPRPLGTRHPSITPFQAFAAADGPIVVAAGNDALFRALCAVLNAPHMKDDPRFATNALRTQHADALEELLNAHLARGKVDEWMARLSTAGIPAAPIRSIDAVMADQSLRARGVLHEMQDGQGNTFTAAGSPIRIDGRVLPLSTTAPQLDADRVNVFQEWGVTQVRSLPDKEA